MRPNLFITRASNALKIIPSSTRSLSTFQPATKSLQSNDPLDWLGGRRPSKPPRTTNIIIHPPVPSAAKVCREPLKTMSAAEFAKLDPTGARRRLFSDNEDDTVQVRDIAMVKTQTGDPFSGVVLRIQRKRHDSSILLRNHINGLGVEREFKIFSPNVTGIEVVQKRTKKPAQSRLFYMRQPKHDIGSVDSIVDAYLRKKKALGQAIKLTAKTNQTKKKHRTR